MTNDFAYRFCVDTAHPVMVQCKNAAIMCYKFNPDYNRDEFFFMNSSDSAAYQVFDVAVDSSLNRYMVLGSQTSGTPLNVAKTDANGTVSWAFEYEGLIAVPNVLSISILSDGSALRIVGDTYRTSSHNAKFVQIRTGG